MKTVLQVVFVIAWLPILWMLLSATIGQMLYAIVGVVWIVQVTVLVCSLLLIFYALRFFSVVSERVFGGKRN